MTVISRTADGTIIEPKDEGKGEKKPASTGEKKS